ncbi:MAG: hypothetical protein AAGF12_04510 [Myxococcota bacterium]
MLFVASAPAGCGAARSPEPPLRSDPPPPTAEFGSSALGPLAADLASLIEGTESRRFSDRPIELEPECGAESLTTVAVLVRFQVRSEAEVYQVGAVVARDRARIFELEPMEPGHIEAEAEPPGAEVQRFAAEIFADASTLAEHRLQPADAEAIGGPEVAEVLLPLWTGGHAERSPISAPAIAGLELGAIARTAQGGLRVVDLLEERLRVVPLSSCTVAEQDEPEHAEADPER